MKVVTKPAYRAIGLVWEGPWSDLSQLKATIEEMRKRVGELEMAIDPKQQLGLAYHTRPDGFTHYSVYEVNQDQNVPIGMIEIHIPELTYLVKQHEKGQDIGHSYSTIAQWLSESNYKPFIDKDVTYFDELPIKHEVYPADRNLQNPHFEIRIPIVKK